MGFWLLNNRQARRRTWPSQRRIPHHPPNIWLCSTIRPIGFRQTRSRREDCAACSSEGEARIAKTLSWVLVSGVHTACSSHPERTRMTAGTRTSDCGRSISMALAQAMGPGSVGKDWQPTRKEATHSGTRGISWPRDPIVLLWLN